MAQVTVEVPDEVFAMPLDGPPPDLSGWDGRGVPDALVLQWVDAQPFTAWSATLLDGIDPSEVPERELPTYLRLLDRMEAHTAARKARAIRQLAGSKETLRSFRELDPAPHEVSVALRISFGESQTLVYRARRLHSHLPGTLAMFEDGLLTARHVAKIVAATGHLDAEQCAEVEARVLDDADLLDAHRFADKVRRVVARIDPDGFRKRHAREAAKADVVHQPDDDAMSWLTARMPTVDAAIVMSAVDAYARERKAAGDARPIGVVRADALRVFAEAYLTGRLGHRPTAHGRPVEIQIAATPHALIGLTDTPAEIPGVGPVPIECVRAMAARAKLRWLTISEDSGRLLDYDPTARRVPGGIHAISDTTYVRSATPHSRTPASRADSDHLTRHPDGPTDPDNIAPFDRPWHRAKTFAGFDPVRLPDGTIEWHTPLGQVIRVHPYDYRLGP